MWQSKREMQIRICFVLFPGACLSLYVELCSLSGASGVNDAAHNDDPNRRFVSWRMKQNNETTTICVWGYFSYTTHFLYDTNEWFNQSFIDGHCRHSNNTMVVFNSPKNQYIDTRESENPIIFIHWYSDKNKWSFWTSFRYSWIPDSEAIFLTRLIHSIWAVFVQGLKWNGHRLKVVFNAGALLWAAGGVGFWVLSPGDGWGIYGLSILVGIGNAFMLVRIYTNLVRVWGLRTQNI